MSDALKALDLDVCDQLRSWSTLAGIFITTVRPRLETTAGVLQSQIEQALAMLGGDQSGGFKPGAVIIVDMPHVDVEKPNIPGPLIELSVPVYCLTAPFYNFGTGGAGVSPELLAQYVLQAHAVTNYEGTTSMAIYPARNAIGLIPGAMLEELGVDSKSVVGYTARVATSIALPPIVRCARPTITNTSNTVTLACGTAGADIYYTLDGGYPGRGNPAAVKYTGPFAIVPPVLIRVGANLSTLAPSSIGALEVEA